MLQKAERPGVGDAGTADYVICLAAFDYQHHTEIAARLQVERLRRRFALSEALAKTVAELAFANQRRAA